MGATQVTTQTTPCGGPLPELEAPMINTLVSCLASEHRKLDELIMQLALAATRLADDAQATTASQRAVAVWDELRRDLWSHLQIEEELVFSWGEAHHAFSDTRLETLKIERQEMRKLMAALPVLSSAGDREPRTARDRGVFARSLLALVQALDSHVQHYEGEVLPSILRAVFHR
jgi:hemerythrin-like domain-containing protein